MPLAALAVIALAVACSPRGGSSGSDAGSSGETLRIVAYQGEEVLGGKEVSFPDLLRRGKPVVLNFWAGLCPPCRQEMPGFQRVYNEHQGEFILVGVDVGPFVGLGSREDARRFLKEFEITYPTAYATSADILREYKVQGMPTTIFFTPDGRVFRKATGFFPEDALGSALKALLAASLSLRQ